MRLLLAALMLSGCVSGTDVGRKSLAVAEQAVIDGNALLPQYDAGHRAALLASKDKPSDYDAAIAAYDAALSKVQGVFDLLDGACHTVKGALDAVDKGASLDTALSALSTLYNVARNLKDASAAIGFQVPFLDQIIPGGK